MKKSEILQIITEEISTVLIPESADQSHRLTEAKLARGLKPLLQVGAKITKKVGEDALMKLSDKFDRIDDEYAGDIASHLDMAIELMQDGYPGDATKKLKQFNKACKDVLAGKEVGSAFEGVNEANRGKVFKAARKGSYPAVIVVVQNGKVIHQEPVSTPEVAPATFNVMQEKYPKALLHLEDRTGKRLFSEGKLSEAKIKKGDAIKMKDGEIGVVNKVKGRVAYIKLDSMPGSFHPIEADRTTYKGKHKGKDLYLEAFNPKSTQQFWNQKMIKAKTMKDVKKLYPKAKKTSEVHGAVFYIELEKDLYAKAFSKNTMKSIEPFTVEAIYSMKGKKQTFLYKEGKLTEAAAELNKLKDAIKMFQDKIKKQGRITNARDEEHLKNLIALYKKMGGKGIKEGKLTESMIGIETKANFKPNSLKGELERAGIKGFRMDRLTWSLSMLKLDSKDLEKAKKIIDTLPKAKIKMVKESKLNEAEVYKYKKFASKAFKEINDAMFNFRHSMGIKTLTNKDMKLKKKVDSLHQAIFSLQKEMKKDGLTEASAKDKFGVPPMNKWWTGDKEALMSAIYHAQRQLPPTNKTDYEKNWKNIVNQLQKKYPAPTAIYKKRLTEAKVQYNFSEDELKRVLKLLGRSASTEVKMIKAFEKAFGRKLTRDELFEGKLNEMDINDPILVAIRARKTDLKKKAALPKVKKISTKQYYKLMDAEIDLIDQMKDAAKDYERLDSEMNQDAGQKGDAWTDADANRYGGDLNKLQTKIEKLAKQKLAVKKQIMNYRIN